MADAGGGGQRREGPVSDWTRIAVSYCQYDVSTVPGETGMPIYRGALRRSGSLTPAPGEDRAFC
ncbi:hypothetical protein [Micromonospora sp. WMMC273]|uniref:hypothetical protein n=1 Tax=Micromonospora sp. WMMC273 TaxID=3015157 RepID=UPI0022B67EB5|nr:hypothetical protein [Micromonospora sp. WMMC273]MCZ7475026.1 hypothetical protein [Micromonospora sp. WMMC273]